MLGTDTRTVGNYAGIRVPEHEKHGTVSPLIFTGGVQNRHAFKLCLCSLLAPFGRFQLSSPLVRIWSNASTRLRDVQALLRRHTVSRFLPIFEGGVSVLVPLVTP